MTQSNWGVALKGEAFDLDDWAASLKPPYDPWVEKRGDNLVLRSKYFDKLSSGEQINAAAPALIERLNGAFAVLNKTKPIDFDGVVEILPNGEHRTLKFAVFHAEGRSKVRAVGSALGSDGKPIPEPPPKESEIQHWLQIAENDKFLDDALIYAGKANWFDIYKALECLSERFGGEEKFLALGWEPKRDIKNLKRAANWERHVRWKYDPPDKPITISEARELLIRLLGRALRGA